MPVLEKIMTQKTYKTRLVAGLIAESAKELPGGKYRVFMLPDGKTMYFVSSKSALRVEAYASQLVSVGCPGYGVFAKGDKALAPEYPT